MFLKACHAIENNLETLLLYAGLYSLFSRNVVKVRGTFCTYCITFNASRACKILLQIFSVFCNLIYSFV